MIRRRILWGLMAVLSLLVVLLASAYFRFDASTYFDEQRAVYLAHQVPLYLHIGGAVVALALLPLQLSARLRDRRPRVHRMLGRLSLAGILVGGVGGLLLAPMAFGGPVASLGFTWLALAWLGCAALGLRAILRHDVRRHRVWMVRTSALTFAAVTLRLYLGLFKGLQSAGLTTVSFATAYAVIAWAAWVPNIVIAWWMTRVEKPMRAGGGHDREPAASIAGEPWTR